MVYNYIRFLRLDKCKRIKLKILEIWKKKIRDIKDYSPKIICHKKIEDHTR